MHFYLFKKYNLLKIKIKKSLIRLDIVKDKLKDK